MCHSAILCYKYNGVMPHSNLSFTPNNVQIQSHDTLLHIVFTELSIIMCNVQCYSVFEIRYNSSLLQATNKGEVL